MKELQGLCLMDAVTKWLLAVARDKVQSNLHSEQLAGTIGSISETRPE